MNTTSTPYPAALFSAVSEVGYRTERFTGEVLRSGNGRRRGRRAGMHRRGGNTRTRFTRRQRGTRQETVPAA